jgi:uncharacterized protein YukE
MGFELPPGDPDTLDGAISRLSTVGTDLHTERGSAQSGFAEALSTWHGTRADDFRKASAGLQLQVQEASTSLDTLMIDLKGYSKKLRQNIEEIKELKKQADRRNAKADQFAADHPGDDATVDLEYQHASMFVGQLERQAEDLRADVRKAASATAGLVEAGVDLAVPHSSSLSPAEIARRVHSTTGVTGIEEAIAAGALTEDGAWGALASPSKEVPENAINADGSINQEKLTEDVKEEVEKEQEEGNPIKEKLDTSLDLWTLASGPSGAWSLAQLAGAARDFSQAKAALPVDLFALDQAELDAIPKGAAPSVLDALSDIEQSLHLTPQDEKAFSSMLKLHDATEEIGGLGKLEVLGRVMDGAAIVGDAWTLLDPDSPADDKVDAGLNALGIGMTTEVGSGLVATGLEATGLVAANAALDWIPVVGWGLAAATAGYEVYKHWDTIKDLGGSAVHSVGNFVKHIHLW